MASTVWCSAACCCRWCGSAHAHFSGAGGSAPAGLQAICRQNHRAAHSRAFAAQNTLIASRTTRAGPVVRSDSLLEQSDCLRCQAGRRVAHKVHSLWDRFKNPGCGLMDNPPLLHAGVGHGGLHGVLSRTMALRIVSILRNTAIRAAFGSTPRPSKRW